MRTRVPTSFKDQQICVLGLGYVGLTLAVAMAEAGFRVHGIEIRDQVIERLDNLEPHFWEPRLKEQLQRVLRLGLFTYSKEFQPSVEASVFVITVGTPLGPDRKAHLRSVEAVAGQVAAFGADGSLVILRSTVKLGTARQVVKPILDASGKSFQLAVCPERTLEGKALIELSELPQIIGADDADTRVRCAQIFNLLTSTTVAVRSLETAEMIKLVDNTYRDVTFAFANEIAALCGSAGISALEVIRAGKLGYARTNLALPGPVGGPCLAKDPHILAESAAQFGIEMGITQASRDVNEKLPERSAAHIRGWSKSVPGFPKAPRICLLGFAFKGIPQTDDLRGSMAIPIHRSLAAQFGFATFSGYDAVVPAEAIVEEFGFPPSASIEEALAGANIVVVMNNHQQFQNMDIAALAQGMAQPGLVFDYWNLHDEAADRMPEGRYYMALGAEHVVPWH
jgi:UDP-N-acetyl-D-mannosaminuronic acid dehydrogenase